MRRLPLLLALGAALATAACDNSPKAPTEAGVCYHVVPLTGGKLRFNEVARNQPNLENCAARLEAMRLEFLRLGGNTFELVGAYQGQFLFLQVEGVFVAQSLTSIRYPALVRTGDGRLAIPGAMPQAAPAVPATPPAK
jgi:hypothetical protein